MNVTLFDTALNFYENHMTIFMYKCIQGCLANLDAGNSDDSGNSDDFLGKSFKLFFVVFPTFFSIFDHINRIMVCRDSILEYVKTMLDL